VRKGKSVQWSTGIGAPGNEGVANGIRGSENSIGYVELAYALTTGMPYAYIQNQAGNFLEPTLASTEAAVAASAANLPTGDASWNNVTLVNAQGADSYPIASFSYLLLNKEMADNPSMTQAKATALLDFIKWAITDGRQFAPELEYPSRLNFSFLNLREQKLLCWKENGKLQDSSMTTKNEYLPILII
jgi:phosphate transport system substrate-binding protein